MSTSSSDSDVTTENDASPTSTELRHRRSQSAHRRKHSYPQDAFVDHNSSMASESRRRGHVEFTLAGQVLNAATAAAQDGTGSIAGEAHEADEIALFDETGSTLEDTTQASDEAGDDSASPDTSGFDVPSAETMLDEHPLAPDRRHSETVEGIQCRWLPRFLREPEMFFLDTRLGKRSKSTR